MTTTTRLAEALRTADATLARDGYHVDHSTRMDIRAALAEYDAARAAFRPVAPSEPPAGAHAAEPWRVSRTKLDQAFIVDANFPETGIVAEINLFRSPELGANGDGIDNARRIVACVNACAGIPTEALEGFKPDPEAIAAYLRATEPVRVVVKLEGGLVQWVGTSSLLPVEVAIIDYDTEGADDDELTAIPQDDGDTAEAFARIETADASDPAWVERAFAAMTAERAP